MDSLEKYIRQGEPSRVEKARNWRTAIGLQQVDGLKPSACLLEAASANIEGDITIDEPLLLKNPRKRLLLALFSK
ncbi:MAG: antitoxin VbhA family protein [Opitutaceae bacterium]|jgi:hypothetical protein|nr:antitoxin VbhA family protein [Opitutaceae bacterium]